MEGLKCQWCNSILHVNDSVFIQMVGNVHRACATNSIRARLRKDDDRRDVRILFIDQGNRNILLYDRQREARDLFPELTFDVTFKGVAPGLDLLKREKEAEKRFDFIFLDAGRLQELDEHVKVLLDGWKDVKEIVFYGVYTVAEKNLIENSYVIPLQLEGRSARILKLSEVVFSKIHEVSYVGA